MTSFSVTTVELHAGDTLRISADGLRDGELTVWLISPEQFETFRESLRSSASDAIEVPRLITVVDPIGRRFVRDIPPGIWFLAWSSEQASGVRFEVKRTTAIVGGGRDSDFLTI